MPTLQGRILAVQWHWHRIVELRGVDLRCEAGQRIAVDVDETRLIVKPIRIEPTWAFVRVEGMREVG
jgi:hypothetical protein